jgi:hypothetical protein
MAGEFESKIRSWTLTLPYGPGIQETNTQIEHLAEDLFDEYEPTRGPYPQFWQRLGSWIANVPDDLDQRTMFEFVPHLFFVGPREMEILHRVAFNTNVARWLIQQMGMLLDDPESEQKLAEAVRRTWFCPITDSMRINGFYHLNHITGRDYRPDWRSLQKFGSTGKLLEFIAAEHIERIVLIEDFIGSGEQAGNAMKFAAGLGLPLLIVPLIVCPPGVDAGAVLQADFPNLTFDPVLPLSRAAFVTPDPVHGEVPIFARIRDIATATFDRVKVGAPAYVGAFGFGDTAAVIVLYTNCPDNTLPMVYSDSAEWEPLFPRASRL